MVSPSNYEQATHYNSRGTTRGESRGRRRTALDAAIDQVDDFENAYSYDNLGRLANLSQPGKQPLKSRRSARSAS